MAQVQTRSRESLPKRLGNFTNTTPGLDMTLRLLQALAMIAEQVCLDNSTVVRCSIAKEQLALGRRYFRFLSGFGCFQRAYSILAGDTVPGGMLLTMSYLVEFTCLGLYVSLEDLTIFHDMNIWLVPWSTTVLTEGSKFWFYAICISIARSLWELLFGFSAEVTTQNGNADSDKKQEKANSPKRTPSAVLLERIVVDSCDLALPGSFLGWIGLGELGVGMAMVVSTILTSREIWARAQA